MPTGERDTLWPAPPHTIAKINILRAYLVAYFQILGLSRPGQDLLYIDGFAGPDEYTNHPGGSPTAALDAARTALERSGEKWKAGPIHCAFVEAREDRFGHLTGRLSHFKSDRIVVRTYQNQFVNALRKIKEDVPGPFASQHPLFVFIDPFGATGAPFETVASLLESSCSEVLINLDADGIGRIFAAKDSANYVRVLNSVFGDSDWAAELLDSMSPAERCTAILHMYKRRLKSLDGVRYVYEVEMADVHDNLSYFLVFASQHPLGLKKMKEAMKRMTQDGNYRFSDRTVGMLSLFGTDDAEEYAPRLLTEFFGKTMAYDSESDEVTAYALNETPFVDAKSMLTLLEKREQITVVRADPNRRRGTFNHTVKAIEFHGGSDGRLF